MTEHSGRFVLRIPPSLHGRLRRLAMGEGVSLNEYCRRALEASVGDAGARAVGPGQDASRWIETAERCLGDALTGVVLFGSVARGEPRSSSDVDLLIVVHRGTPVTRELYRLWDAAGADPRVSPHFVHLPDGALAAGSLWYEVALDGAVLTERGSAVSTMLREIRHAIARRTIERRVAHGHPYWVKRSEGTHAE